MGNMTIPFTESQEERPNLRDSARAIVPSIVEWRHGLGAVARCLLCYGLTSAVVVLGVVFGRVFVDVLPGWPVKKGSLMMAFASEDGRWYKQIVANGYFYNPEVRSTVAFFPGIQFWPAL